MIKLNFSLTLSVKYLNMTVRATSFIFILLFSVAYVQGQTVRNLSESQQMMRMDEGVEYMNTGKFALADDIFREVLKNVEVVPADLCFYFGKNSYHLSKFSQSIDWLNKYIEIKGTSGRFFDQAVEYKQLAEADMKMDSDNEASLPQHDRAPERNRVVINCTETPLIVCPVCKGEGVIIQSGALGSTIYRPCKHCKESGRMTCENYKLYIKGDLIP